MTDKVIVSNGSALVGKYGTAGFNKIAAALKRLVVADRTRGIKTSIVYLDNAAAMQKLGAPPVTVAGDTRQNKAAIDAVYKGMEAPDYVMILGSIDIVPHQDLKNPAYSPGADDDQFAPGDVPYASNRPYSQRPEDFLTVTRVVGRLPDLTGGHNPGYLVDAIDTAAGYTQRDPAKYAPHLGVSADVWTKSTAQSLTNIFGSAASLQLSPKKGPAWGASLRTLAHFFNCHGAQIDPHFYGQKGTGFPIAHESVRVLNKVREGVVCAAECCYGAQLYDPGLAGATMPICNAYLGSAGYAYFGSSTIAYGPAVGNGAADLICQYFLRRVIGGASTGRAALEARQDFVRAMSIVDPIDLKTLAQFSLLGDPSIHPVTSIPSGGLVGVPKGVGMKTMGPLTASLGAPVEQRRLRLATFGTAIGAAAAFVKSEARTAGQPNVKAMLRAAMRNLAASPLTKALQLAPANMDIDSMMVYSFDVQSPGGLDVALSKFAAASPRVVHLAIGAKNPTGAPGPQVTAIVALEQAKAIGGVRVLVSR